MRITRIVATTIGGLACTAALASGTASADTMSSGLALSSGSSAQTAAILYPQFPFGPLSANLACQFSGQYTGSTEYAPNTGCFVYFAG